METLTRKKSQIESAYGLLEKSYILMNKNKNHFMEKQIRAISIPFSTVKKAYKAGSPRKYWDSGLLAFSNYVVCGRYFKNFLIIPFNSFGL